ncbi:acid protease [Hypoxylon sp. NC1633]|nr:acid protease [Hypoxylon sp. NC1633]
MELAYLIFYVAGYVVLFAGQVQAAVTRPSNTTHNGTIDATSFYKNTAQVLSLPLKRVEHQGLRTPSLARRYFGTDILGVYGAAYFAELMLGTVENPQTVDVLIDTGSFELWVNPDCTTTNVQQYCEAFGHYDPSVSATSQDLNTSFFIQYGQGSASGTYYTDDVYISGARVQDQQFGVSNASSDVWFGILGLGHGQGGGVIEYPSVVDSLAAQGYTESKLFSLDLGGQPGPTAAVTGEMVFGGVDTNKYSGTLAKVPTDPSDAHYVVTLNSISLNAPTTSNAVSRRQAATDPNFPLPVVVDSGTTLSLLPESLVSSIAAEFSGAQPDGNGGYTVPCDLRDTDGSLSFTFQGDGDTVTITVSYADFIWNGGDSCVLGVAYSAGLGVWILGDTFLRGAYVTFDQSNNALYMAEYTPCGDGSNLVPVPAGPDAAASIPGACTAPESDPAPAAQRIPSPTATRSDGGLVSTTGEPSPATTLHRQASADDDDDDCDDEGRETGRQRVAHATEETFTATETFTSTIVRHVVYSAGSQRVTSHETFVTTFCPGDVLPSPAPAPAAPQPQPQPHTRPRTRIQSPSRPTAAAHSAASPSAAEATMSMPMAQATIVTTERCSTQTFVVESCDNASDQACVVGATTTQVVTMLETLSVQSNPEPSSSLLFSSSSSSAYSPSLPSSSPSSSQSGFFYSHPLPPPPSPSSVLSQSIPPGAGIAYGGMSWGFNASAPTAGVAIAGPSRGAVAVAPAVPTKAQTQTQMQNGVASSTVAFAMPTSGGARVWVGKGVGALVVVAVAVTGFGVVV